MAVSQRVAHSRGGCLLRRRPSRVGEGGAGEVGEEERVRVVVAGGEPASTPSRRRPRQVRQPRSSLIEVGPVKLARRSDEVAKVGVADPARRRSWPRRGRRRAAGRREAGLAAAFSARRRDGDQRGAAELRPDSPSTPPSAEPSKLTPPMLALARSAPLRSASLHRPGQPRLRSAPRRRGRRSRSSPARRRSGGEQAGRSSRGCRPARARARPAGCRRRRSCRWSAPGRDRAAAGAGSRSGRRGCRGAQRGSAARRFGDRHFVSGGRRARP